MGQRGPLVGRGRELATLIAALDRAATGQGGLVVLAGDAGIGKSRLAAEVVEEARLRGRPVFPGRAVAGPKTVAFRPLTEVLLAATRAGGFPETPALRPFLPALERLLLGHGDGPGDSSPVVLGEALMRALTVLAGPAGAVVALEDLHWADADTVAVVDHLADHLASTPLLAVTMVRTSGRDRAGQLVRSLASRHAATVLWLHSLSREAVAELVALHLGGPPSDELLAVIVERSEGVPFAVRELVAAGPELAAARVPTSVAVAVEARLTSLLPETQRAVDVAAVLGRSFDVELVAAVCGVASEQTGRLLAAAVEAGVLDPAGDGRVRFRHALTREAVLARLLPSTQAALARTAVGLLERREPLTPPERDLAASLCSLSGDEEGAARHLLAAGRDAMGSGALRTAVEVLTDARGRARGAPLQLDIDEALVEALAASGRTEEAFAVGARLLEQLETARAHPGRVVRAHLLLAANADTATRWDAAGRHLAEARLLVRDGGDPVQAARVDVREAHVAIATGQLARAVELAEAALCPAERLGLPDVAAEAWEVIGRRERLRNLDSARCAFERALVVADRHDLPVHRLRAMHELGTIDMLTEAEIARLEEARALAEGAGAIALTTIIDLQLVGARAFLFEAEAALRSGARCVSMARTLRLDRVLVMGLLQTACAQAVAGNRDAMEALVEEALDHAGDDPEVHAVAMGHCRATLSLLEERREDALQELDAAMSAVRRMDGGVPPGFFTGLWALVATLTDRDGAAARAFVASSELVDHPFVGEVVQLAEAVAAGRQGRIAEAEELVAAADRSLRVRRRLRHLRLLLLRLVAEAAVDDGWGQPIVWLREAHDRFADTPHAAVRNACAALLRRAGASVPRRPTPAVPPAFAASGLTPRELEVLTLVAERLGNQEIAERLFVSPRTVEKHVERVLTKTGATDRHELAARARRCGLGTT